VRKWAKKHYEKEGEKSGEMPIGKEIVQFGQNEHPSAKSAFYIGPSWAGPEDEIGRGPRIGDGPKDPSTPKPSQVIKNMRRRAKT
jgi:hypothetical protein